MRQGFVGCYVKIVENYNIYFREEIFNEKKNYINLIKKKFFRF